MIDPALPPFCSSLYTPSYPVPGGAEGEVILVTVAFERDVQEMVDSWIHYFEELCEGKKAYELPVIEGSFWKVFSGFIDRGMKSGIPQEKQDSVVTYYGDASDFKEKLEIEDKSLGYVFLLDEDGRIMFKGEGHDYEEGKEDFLKHVKMACGPEDDY